MSRQNNNSSATGHGRSLCELLDHVTGLRNEIHGNKPFMGKVLKMIGKA